MIPKNHSSDWLINKLGSGLLQTLRGEQTIGRPNRTRPGFTLNLAIKVEPHSWGTFRIKSFIFLGLDKFDEL